jgi:hypothetical protein
VSHLQYNYKRNDDEGPFTYPVFLL